jgi:hypothetical protein
MSQRTASTGLAALGLKATATYGQWSGECQNVTADKDIFTAYANKRVTFSVPAHKDGAKGFYVKRKDYNGKPQLLIWGWGYCKPLLAKLPKINRQRNTHSQNTQAFPVNTGNTPAPQRQQQRQGVEGVTAGMASPLCVEDSFSANFSRRKGNAFQ